MNGAQEQIRNLYGLLVRVASSLQSPLLLCIRVYFGLWPAGIALNGWGKLHNLPHVTAVLRQPWPSGAGSHRRLCLHV